MSEADTSREAVEIMAEYYAGWARDIRAKGVHSQDAGYRDETAATLRALLDRAEKAEAERDAAWNEAIEAAARRMAKGGLHTISDRVEAIRALRKGDTPAPDPVKEAARVLSGNIPNPIFDVLKYHMSGEFQVRMEWVSEDGDDEFIDQTIEWTTIKEIR
ncbi:hypothetical protein [Oceaniglobus trochenteri]|uniref:hypothetical protein n=1 Tax=Oceaniglobus trochenteri TaxID=2763260 RepID=UPI001CFFE5E4|nr:hypothetical protein [Oceaniglobus trochenteri]